MIEAFCTSVIPTTALLLLWSTSSTVAPFRCVALVPSAASTDIPAVSIAALTVSLNAKVRFSVLRLKEASVSLGPDASDSLVMPMPATYGERFPVMSWNAPSRMTSCRGPEGMDDSCVFRDMTATSVSVAGSVATAVLSWTGLPPPPVTLIRCSCAADAL